MWVVLNNAMLSIVEDLDNKDRLLVRARIRGDIEQVFEEAQVSHTPFFDYPFRASIHRAEVDLAISDAIRGIDYGNFKDSVSSDARHDFYFGIWEAMHPKENLA